MASATMAFSCSSLCATLKLPQTQTPLLPNLPLSKPISRFLSPPLLSLERLSLSPISAFRKGRRRISDDDDDDDDEENEENKVVIEGVDENDLKEIPEYRTNPKARPKLSDVLADEIDVPKPGTPEFDAILEKILPKKKIPPPREEIFAVVMVGSRQYIVIPGRWIVTQRLKGANVNDKIVLNKVLLVGTKNSTYIGKPVVTNAVVHAVVEEQLLDDKVIVFKYKKKKNYRRNIGHRQPITRIKITGITGYEDYPASTLEPEAASTLEPAAVSS